MNTPGVGPEEPIFYAAVFGGVAYLIYLLAMQRLQRHRRKRWIANIKGAISSQEAKLKALESNLRSELQIHYPAAWIDMAFGGEVFSDMPAILLLLSLGQPDDVSFSGTNQQTWRYKGSENLAVNLWKDKVVSWAYHK